MLSFTIFITTFLDYSILFSYQNNKYINTTLIEFKNAIKVPNIKMSPLLIILILLFSFVWLWQLLKIKDIKDAIETYYYMKNELHIEEVHNILYYSYYLYYLYYSCCLL